MRTQAIAQCEAADEQHRDLMNQLATFEIERSRALEEAEKLAELNVCALYGPLL